MSVYVGTSGWSYEHWRDVLYPPGLSAARRLAYYSERFATVEVNSTFYHWPREATFASWAARLPADFRLSVKAPRGLTHGARLRSPETWLARLETAMHALGPKRGAILFQLPPDLPFDADRLATLLRAVPPWLRVAVEFREPSWDREDTYRLLEDNGAAYCVMSGAGLHCVLRATAPFVYIRLHGPDRERLYAGSYPEADLRWWAARIQEWVGQGRDVFAYFNNDGEGNAVRNAEALRRFGEFC